MRSPVTPAMSLITVGELEVHLEEGLLHALHVGSGALHQGLAVPQIGPQGRDRGGRSEAASEQPNAVQLLQPLAVHDIGLAAGDVLHMTRVDEHHVEAAGFEDLVERNPVDPGGFHRHSSDAAGGKPVGEAMEIRREGRERAHRSRLTIGRDGDIMLLGSAIDAGGIRVDALQQRGVGRRCSPVTTLGMLHGRLLSTAWSTEPPRTGRQRTDILLNGITRRAACHHCSRRSLPWATL